MPDPHKLNHLARRARQRHRHLPDQRVRDVQRQVDIAQVLEETARAERRGDASRRYLVPFLGGVRDRQIQGPRRRCVAIAVPLPVPVLIGKHNPVRQTRVRRILDPVAVLIRVHRAPNIGRRVVN